VGRRQQAGRPAPRPAWAARRECQQQSILDQSVTLLEQHEPDQRECRGVEISPASDAGVVGRGSRTVGGLSSRVLRWALGGRHGRNGRASVGSAGLDSRGLRVWWPRVWPVAGAGPGRVV